MTFAVIALLLALAGVYAVMAYSVNQRLPELGVRVALGASPSNIMTLVLGHGARLAAAGLTIGVGLSLLAGRALQNLLFGVTPWDPLMLAVVPVAVAVATAAACYIPGRRAVRVDPMIALRRAIGAHPDGSAIAAGALHRGDPGLLHNAGDGGQERPRLRRRRSSRCALVAIINESLARVSFQGEDPIGRRIQCGLDNLEFMTIVGVVSDVRTAGPTRPAQPEIYMPFEQHPGPATALNIVARTQAADPRGLAETITRKIRERNADVPVKVTTMERTIDSAAATPRFRTLLLMTFAVIALLLALAGVYAVMAYSVNQRLPELGVRVALGASPSNIMTLVLGHGARLAAAGLTIGVGLSLLAGRALQNLLFGVTPSDPLMLADRSCRCSGCDRVRLLHSWPARGSRRSDDRAADRVRTGRAETSRCSEPSTGPRQAPDIELRWRHRGPHLTILKLMPLALCVLTVTVSAQDPLARINQETTKLTPALTEIRHQIHQNPGAVQP